MTTSPSLPSAFAQRSMLGGSVDAAVGNATNRCHVIRPDPSEEASMFYGKPIGILVNFVTFAFLGALVIGAF